MATFNQDEVRAKILLNSIEESALHEILWDLNSEFPEIPLDNKIEVIRHELNIMLQAKLISLYQSLWGDERIKLIYPNNWDNILNDKNSWEVPAIGEKYFLIITSAKFSAEPGSSLNSLSS